VNDPRLPVRSGPRYCRDARRRAAILILIVTLTSKAFADSRSHAERKPLRIASAHHQTVFKPPFMTASALPLDFMTVERSTRWLPRRPKPSAQSQGGCAASGLRLANSRNPSVGVQMVGEPCRRVESRLCFLRKFCRQLQTRNGGALSFFMALSVWARPTA
jgi:hypothetical protein